MKHALSVFLGAASYGVLSTIVVLAYGSGYTLGEVVGSQMLVGFLLTWRLAAYIRGRRGSGAGAGIESRRVKRAAKIGGWRQRALLMAAGMPTAVTGLLYYESLRYIPASLAILLLFQFTWIGVLIQAVRKRRRPESVIYWTLFILLSGTALAAGVMEGNFVKFHIRGLLLGFLSAISYSLFILFSGRAVPDAHPAERSKWMMAGALLLVFMLFPPHFLWSGEPLGELFLFGALLGLFGAFIPPLLFAYGVPHIGEGLAGILGAAELPVAVLLSSVILHEEVSMLQWLGVALVLAGVAFPEWRKRMRIVRNKGKAAAQG